MNRGGKVAVNLNTGGDIGHSVVLQRAIRQTITKINGIPKTRYYFYVMDPMRRNYVRISGKDIRNALNIFHIFPAHPDFSVADLHRPCMTA